MRPLLSTVSVAMQGLASKRLGLQRWGFPFRSSSTLSSGPGLRPPPGLHGQAPPVFRVRPVIKPADCLCDADGWMGGYVKGAQLKYADSSALRLRRRAVIQWEEGSPSQVLIVKKPKNAAASSRLGDIAAWLTARGIRVYVERAVHATEFPQYEAYDPASHSVDFCVTLGGDGTVLHLASLFEADDPLPPVVSFAMGTLGFLTPFDVCDFARCLERVLDTSQEPLFCTLRTRKRVEMHQDGQLVGVHNVLNEVVIDRGAFPGAVLLELFADGHFVTNIEADGLIIATPSGSTAYSMSAGGPMVAPSVPCTILTPIAPLSLSFRPLVIPETSDIVIHLPAYARSYARCSFDGKKPQRMRKDCSLTVSTSLCPLPMINLGTLDSDWYEGITSKLKWNQTIRQPPKLEDILPCGVGHTHSNISSIVASSSIGLASGSCVDASSDGGSSNGSSSNGSGSNGDGSGSKIRTKPLPAGLAKAMSSKEGGVISSNGAGGVGKEA